MKSSRTAICLLLAVVLLASCSSTKTRPPKVEGSAESYSQAPDSSTFAPSEQPRKKGKERQRRVRRNPVALAPPRLPAGRDLKIGFILPQGDPGAAFGFSVAIPDLAPETRAMADEVNSTGGIAGRKVAVYFAYVDQQDQTPSTQARLMNEACTKLIEDDGVFMVLSAIGYEIYNLGCFYDHATPLLGFGGFLDAFEIKRFSPWVLPGLMPNVDRVAHTLASALKSQGMMTNRMGVFASDIEIFKRSLNASLIPAIEQNGGRVQEIAYYREDSYLSDLETDALSAVLKFKEKNIDRVVLWEPGGGGWVIFARQAQSQGYFPRYGISSLDGPELGAILLPPTQLLGAAGAGWNPMSDVPEERYPPTDAERKCWEVMRKRLGKNYSSRSLRPALQGLGAAIALVTCTYFNLLRAGLAPATGKELRASDVYRYWRSIGRFEPSYPAPFAEFTPNKIDGATSYSPLAYEPTCRCFDYTGPWIPMNN